MIQRSVIYGLSLVTILCAACSTEDRFEAAEGISKMVKLNIALDSPTTRSIDLPYDNGDAVALNIDGVKVIAYDIESIPILEETIKFTKGVQTGGSTNYSAELSVPVEVKRVRVEFNSDDMNVAGVGTLGSDVNSRQGGSTEAVVRVSGEGLVLATNTVSITAYAEMARLQIVDDVTTPTSADPTTYKDLSLQAIYINNIKIEREGAKVLTADADLNTAYSATGSKRNLFDELTDCTITDADGVYTLSNMENTHFFTGDVATPEYPKDIVDGNRRGETIGYNLFPQGEEGGYAESDANTAKENLPFIILKIGYTEKLIGSTWTHVDVVNGLSANDGKDENNFSYVKVIAFDNVIKSFPSYVGGKVYEFNMSDLLALITTPTESEEPIKIKVTIKDWLYQELDLILPGGGMD